MESSGLVDRNAGPRETGMMEQEGSNMSRKRWTRAARAVAVLAAFALIAAACGDDSTTAQTVTVTSIVEVPVEVEVEVEVPGATVTSIVEVPGATVTSIVEVEVEVTATTMIGVRTFDTGYGPTIIDGVPKRVFAWGLQGTETLSVLGVQPVAYTTRGDSPMPFWFETTWNETTPLAQPPALELVVALEPDFILSAESNDVTAMRGVAPVLRIRANSFGQSMSQLLTVGNIFGLEDVAQEFIDGFYAELNETTDAIAGRDPVSVMVVYPGIEPGILGMWLDTSFTGSLVTALGTEYALTGRTLAVADLGGRNLEFSTRFGLVQLGLEKLIELDPQVLFVLGTDSFLAGLAENPAWATLTAVDSGQVHLFDRDLWSRSRGPLAAQIMLREARVALYPDLFTE